METVCSMDMLKLNFKADIPTSEVLILVPILISLEVKISVTVMTLKEA